MASARVPQTHLEVYLRLRPMNEKEIQISGPVVHALDKGVLIEEEVGVKKFKFDQVFGEKATQSEVFQQVMEPIITDVLEGFNCTLFTYGPTGTGKTYTMEGRRPASEDLSWEDDPQSGILPRSIDFIFNYLSTRRIEGSIKVSYLELYNEEIYDLLSSKDELLKLRIFSNASSTLVIQGLKEITISSKSQLLDIFVKGAERRPTAHTLLNTNSSRSHSIFTITITCNEMTSDNQVLSRVGKLNLVDLAGSENIGKSGVNDKGAREASNINRSLLSLVRVINQLATKQPHVSYRDSKLTRLLQDSLGGSTRTAMIVTISPAKSSLDETLSTLSYAERAKSVTCKPVKHLKVSRDIQEEYKKEVELLRKLLLVQQEKSGVYMPLDDYNNFIKELEVFKNEDKAYKCKIIEIEDKQRDFIRERDELRSENFILQKEKDEALAKVADLIERQSRSQAEMIASLADYDLALLILTLKVVYKNVNRNIINSEVNRELDELKNEISDLKKEMDEAVRKNADMIETQNQLIKAYNNEMLLHKNLSKIKNGYSGRQVSECFHTNGKNIIK